MTIGLPTGDVREMARQLERRQTDGPTQEALAGGVGVVWRDPESASLAGPG